MEDRRRRDAAECRLRRVVEVRDKLLTIKLTGPEIDDPQSPGSPGISGLSVRRLVKFIRGDSDGDGAVTLTDAVSVLTGLFGGDAASGCRVGRLHPRAPPPHAPGYGPLHQHHPPPHAPDELVRRLGILTQAEGD